MSCNPFLNSHSGTARRRSDKSMVGMSLTAQGKPGLRHDLRARNRPSLCRGCPGRNEYIPRARSGELARYPSQHGTGRRGPMSRAGVGPRRSGRPPRVSVSRVAPPATRLSMVYSRQNCRHAPRTPRKCAGSRSCRQPLSHPARPPALTGHRRQGAQSGGPAGKAGRPPPSKDPIKSGRDMDEGHGQPCSRQCMAVGARAVDAGGQRLFLLGPVDNRVSGGVDDACLAQGQGSGRGTCRDRQIGPVAAHAKRIGARRASSVATCPVWPKTKDHALTPSRWPTPARFCKARHQSSFARYHSTVRRSPSSTVTDGRQPSSVRMRVGSMA